MSDAVNPYAPPVARVDDSQVDSAAQAIRRAHINTEASTKTVGISRLVMYRRERAVN